MVLKGKKWPFKTGLWVGQLHLFSFLVIWRTYLSRFEYLFRFEARLLQFVKQFKCKACRVLIFCKMEWQNRWLIFFGGEKRDNVSVRQTVMKKLILFSKIEISKVLTEYVLMDINGFNYHMHARQNTCKIKIFQNLNLIKLSEYLRAI